MNCTNCNAPIDLSAIPDAPFYSELGRRRHKPTSGAKPKYQACAKCNEQLNATQWRLPCRFCKFRNRRKDWKVSK